MQAPPPEQSAGPGQSGRPLWLGAVLLLALLLATPLAKAQAAEPAHAGDSAAPASFGLAYEGASLDARHAPPSELPHCHHHQAWRPSLGPLPRGETPDSAPEPPGLTTQFVGPPPHRTSPLGHAHPGPDARSSVPLYLLTQRFRS